MKNLLILAGIICLLPNLGFGQGLENVILETYYISDANDATDGDGGVLVEGSTTYRIFIDMAPGYELQAVYGNSNHPLTIATTTEFFNNEDRGEETGDAINDSRLDENTVALDSWLTLGAASDEHIAVLKTDDADGSIVGGDNNDGGSEGISGGLLANENGLAGIPLTNSDGLVLGNIPSGVVTVGLDLSVFADVNDGPLFTTSGGAWSVLEGVQGVTASNTVIIAQITTDGDFSYELNVQLGTPDGGVEKYVASNPVDDEIQFPGLTFPMIGIDGCTQNGACNYNPNATNDDGSCVFATPNCTVCVGDTLDLIDSDGDGVCDADEILGCMSDTACNYQPNATDEDGSCLEAVPDCTVCNDLGGVDLVDSDGDGICDGEEIVGCTSEITACNYNPEATDEEPCIVPIPNCAECNVNNDALILIDSDGDGICDADDTDCSEDLNNDQVIDTLDLLLLLSEFGCEVGCAYSIDGNENVNTTDLLMLLSAFGTSCN